MERVMNDCKDKLRILYITEGFGSEFFGVSKVLMQLTAYLSEHNVEYAISAAKLGNVPEGKREHVYELPIFPFSLRNNTFSRILRWHPGMYRSIRDRVREYKPNIIHVHGMLSPIQLIAVKIARAEKIPVIISAHGMLEPWTWRQKGLLYYIFKRLYWNVFFKPVLKKTDYIHSITGLEGKNLEGEFPNIAQIQISNGVEQAEIDEYVSPVIPDRYFLFLGRLHPKKGVDLLIRAFHKANLDRGWRLLIVGPDFDPHYSLTLRNLAVKLGIEDSVEFKGSIYGSEKRQLLLNAWVTVVPSHSEVVGLVNLESAVAFTPTITTHLTGLDNWGESGGILINPEVDELASALSFAASWSLDERSEMGAKARRFVVDQYEWNVIGPKWINAYEQIVHKHKSFYNTSEKNDPAK